MGVITASDCVTKQMHGNVPGRKKLRRNCAKSHLRKKGESAGLLWSTTLAGVAVASANGGWDSLSEFVPYGYKLLSLCLSRNLQKSPWASYCRGNADQGELRPSCPASGADEQEYRTGYGLLVALYCTSAKGSAPEGREGATPCTSLAALQSRIGMKDGSTSREFFGSPWQRHLTAYGSVTYEPSSSHEESSTLTGGIVVHAFLPAGRRQVCGTGRTLMLTLEESLQEPENADWMSLATLLLVIWVLELLPVEHKGSAILNSVATQIYYRRGGSFQLSRSHSRRRGAALAEQAGPRKGETQAEHELHASPFPDCVGAGDRRRHSCTHSRAMWGLAIVFLGSPLVVPRQAQKQGPVVRGLVVDNADQGALAPGVPDHHSLRKNTNPEEDPDSWETDPDEFEQARLPRDATPNLTSPGGAAAHFEQEKLYHAILHPEHSFEQRGMTFVDLGLGPNRAAGGCLGSCLGGLMSRVGMTEAHSAEAAEWDHNHLENLKSHAEQGQTSKTASLLLRKVQQNLREALTGQKAEKATQQGGRGKSMSTKMAAQTLKAIARKETFEKFSSGAVKSFAGDFWMALKSVPALSGSANGLQVLTSHFHEPGGLGTWMRKELQVHLIEMVAEQVLHYSFRRKRCAR
ncbi:unnamed protein product [Amoebophrya sp. A120]|nr:unnamed protein product [Amoebophrya sp. A120]|eukprot:GSA120T00005208001.1